MKRDRKAPVQYSQTGSKPPVRVASKENPLLEVGDTFYSRQTLYLIRALDAKVWEAGIGKSPRWQEYPDYPKREEELTCEKCGTVLRKAVDYQRSYAGTQEEFVVTETALMGGSGGRDAFPDGHRVTAQSLRDPNFRIQFYQTGSFIDAVLVTASHIRKSGKRLVERPIVIS